MASPNSALQHLQTGAIGTGRGYVDFIIDELPLLPGDYLLSTSVTDRDRMHVHDAWERSHSLRIVPDHPLNERPHRPKRTMAAPRTTRKGLSGHPNR